MLKIIVICILFICVVQCFDGIPPAAEIRKVVEARRAEIDLEHQRMVEESEKWNQQLREKEQRQKEEKERAREIERATIVETLTAHCVGHANKVIPAVAEMVKMAAKGDELDVSFKNIDHHTAYCMMRILMDSSFCVTYIPRNEELKINLANDASQSRVEMMTSGLCGDAITYAINCAQNPENWALFHWEFAKCMETEHNYCFNAHDYAGMKEISRYTSMTMCV